MKKVKVELKGVTPLLMNNPQSMIDKAQGEMKQITAKYDLEQDAKKLAYKTKSGELYIPATAIKGCLIGGASYRKFGKHTAKPILSAGVFIVPDQVLLGTKKYELDIRTVVIQRQRVVKARPTIKDWKVSFELNYDETLINDGESMIKPILEDAGKRVGLLDFRPQKLGSFGTFEVTKWQEE